MTKSAVLSVPAERCIRVQPVALHERLASLDVIRGLGVFGILIVNIQSFALVSDARSIPMVRGDGLPVNRAIWFLTHVVADGKFMAIFSFLFGAGICLMSERLEARGLDSGPFYFRRMGFLILIGIMHSYLLWSGDILFAYGICGSICWLFRRYRPRTLFLLGLIILAIGEYLTLSIWSPSANGFLVSSYQVLHDALHIPETSAVQETLNYRGTWLQQMVLRIPSSLDAEIVSFWIVTFWRTCGSFLVGMGLYKTGFLTGSLPNVKYWWMIFLGVVTVLISCFVGRAYLHFGPSFRNGFLIDYEWNAWLSIPIALGWATIGILLVKLDGFLFLKSALQAVGRAAFTNYIMQTIICTTLFYGHGFGLYGRLDRMHLMSVVAAICIAQLICSTIWLRHFAFGPIEWLLRCVTYWARPDSYRSCAITATSQALPASAD
jgi:uncharacterized protein